MTYSRKSVQYHGFAVFIVPLYGCQHTGMVPGTTGDKSCTSKLDLQIPGYKGAFSTRRLGFKTGWLMSIYPEGWKHIMLTLQKSNYCIFHVTLHDSMSKIYHKSLKLYPEIKMCGHPTTAQVPQSCSKSTCFTWGCCCCRKNKTNLYIFSWLYIEISQ